MDRKTDAREGDAGKVEAPAPVVQRDAKTGRYLPGCSGNPGGRPRDTPGVGELARSAAGLACLTLMRICSDRVAAPHVQMRAAEYLLRRGFGKVEIARPDGRARYAGLRQQVQVLLDAFERENGTDVTGGDEG